MAVSINIPKPHLEVSPMNQFLGNFGASLIKSAAAKEQAMIQAAQKVYERKLELEDRVYNEAREDSKLATEFERKKELKDYDLKNQGKLKQLEFNIAKKKELIKSILNKKEAGFRGILDENAAISKFERDKELKRLESELEKDKDLYKLITSKKKAAFKNMLDKDLEKYKSNLKPNKPDSKFIKLQIEELQRLSDELGKRPDDEEEAVDWDIRAAKLQLQKDNLLKIISSPGVLNNKAGDKTNKESSVGRDLIKSLSLFNEQAGADLYNFLGGTASLLSSGFNNTALGVQNLGSQFKKGLGFQEDDIPDTENQPSIFDTIIKRPTTKGRMGR